MSDNMIRILERGDRLENIDHRTEALHASVTLLLFNLNTNEKQQLLRKSTFIILVSELQDHG
jgi:hypothetical protein